MYKSFCLYHCLSSSLLVIAVPSSDHQRYCLKHAILGEFYQSYLFLPSYESHCVMLLQSTMVSPSPSLLSTSIIQNGLYCNLHSIFLLAFLPDTSYDRLTSHETGHRNYQTTDVFSRTQPCLGRMTQWSII